MYIFLVIFITNLTSNEVSEVAFFFNKGTVILASLQSSFMVAGFNDSSHTYTDR